MENPIRSLLLGVASLALFATAARAGTILAANSTWTVTGGNGLAAGTYQAPFGNATYSYTTYWPANTTLDLQAVIDLTGYDLSTVEYSIAIDNDYTLSVNGNQIGSLVHNGLASWGPWTALTDATSGLNTIDVVAIDRGGGTFFDMQIIGDLAPVPDGEATVALLGAGLIGLLALRRKFVLARLTREARPERGCSHAPA